MLKIAAATLVATASLALTLAPAEALTRHHPAHPIHHMRHVAQPAPYYEEQMIAPAPMISEPGYFEQAAPDSVGGK